MKYIKLSLSIALLAFGLWGAFHNRAFWIIDGVNLGIHESGHLVFGLFQNEFIAFLGGTLLQLIMPLTFVGYFLMQSDKFSASVMLWWFGQNFFHISPYIKDARSQVLPLVGGGVHDWGYLLDKLNLLHLDQQIGNIAWLIGLYIIISASIDAIKHTLRSN